MATPGPGPVFAIRNEGHIFVKIWNENHRLAYDVAEKLANDIYDALGIEHVTRPIDIEWMSKERWSLFNDKAINDALSSTISQNDQLTNAALILANNIAAVMKLHGFSFDQAMMIVQAAKGGE